MSDELVCQRCLKKFTTKSNLKRHITGKKNKCRLRGVRVSNKRMLNQLKRKTKGYTCKKCDKNFKYKANYDKHNCFDPINNSHLTSGGINGLSKRLSEQKEMLNYLVKSYENNSNNNVAMNKVINHVNNTMNIMNQNNINITINDFGKEDVSHITNQFILNIISKMNRSSLLRYIKAVHCDNPYNLNIILPNTTQKLVLIWKNGQWILDNKKTVLDGMIVKNFDRINDIYESIEHQLPKAIQEGYTYYADAFDRNDKERQEIQKGAEYLLSKFARKKLIKGRHQ